LEDDPMEKERRRVPRFQFIAPAELVDQTSGAQRVAWLSDLGSRGCSLGITDPFPEGTALRVKIENAKEFVEARATVVYSRPNHAGVVFNEVKPGSIPVLNRWLATAKFPKGRL
jgi:PilZ domain